MNIWVARARVKKELQNMVAVLFTDADPIVYHFWSMIKCDGSDNSSIKEISFGHQWVISLMYNKMMLVPLLKFKWSTSAHSHIDGVRIFSYSTSVPALQDLKYDYRFGPNAVTIEHAAHSKTYVGKYHGVDVPAGSDITTSLMRY